MLRGKQQKMIKNTRRDRRRQVEGSRRSIENMRSHVKISRDAKVRNYKNKSQMMTDRDVWRAGDDVKTKTHLEADVKMKNYKNKSQMMTDRDVWRAGNDVKTKTHLEADRLTQTDTSHQTLVHVDAGYHRVLWLITRNFEVSTVRQLTKTDITSHQDRKTLRDHTRDLIEMSSIVLTRHCALSHTALALVTLSHWPLRHIAL